MGSNDPYGSFDNSSYNSSGSDSGKFYNLGDSSSASYESSSQTSTYSGDGFGTGIDRASFSPSGDARVSLREQSVLVKSLAFMALAMVISAITASAGYAWGKTHIYEYASMIMPALIIELVVYFIALWALNKGNEVVATIGYVAYSAMSGLTLSVIFFVYQLGSIFAIFIVTAIMFGAVAAYGYFTKTDLKPLGTFFAMALLGIIGVGLINMFFRSEMVYNVVAVFGVVLFAGITAYDIQRLKEVNVQYADSSENMVAMYGGLMLYLDFVNIFLKLLRLFGRSRD